MSIDPQLLRELSELRKKYEPLINRWLGKFDATNP